MSTIGSGSVGGDSSAGLAFGLVAAAPLILIGAGAMGVVYAGKYLKRQLDAREAAIAAEEQAYFNAALANQSAADDAIQDLTENIVMEMYVESPVQASWEAVSTPLVERVQRETEQLRAELSAKNAQKAAEYLKEYRARKRAARERLEKKRMIQLLQRRYDRALKADLSAALAQEIGDALKTLAALPQSEAASRYRMSIEKLDQWFATQPVEEPTVGNYAHERALQEFGQVSLYVQSEGLSVSQDPDLAPWCSEALHEARQILIANQSCLEHDPAEARRQIEGARLSVVHAMAEGRERLKHAREDLKNEMEMARAKVRTADEMLNEIALLQIPLTGDEHARLTSCKEQLVGLETSLREGSESIEHIRERVVRVKKQAAETRGSLERTLSRRQREGIAGQVQEVLNELHYTSETDQPVQMEALGDAWRVAGYRRIGHGSKAGAIFRITEDAQGNIRLWHDLEGFKGKECLQAKDEILSALRSRGIPIEENPNDQLVFDDHLRQETIGRLETALRNMGYQNIHKVDLAGTVKIEAYNGPVGYTIRVPSVGEPEVFHETEDGKTPVKGDELEKTVGLSTQPDLVETERLRRVRRLQEQSKQALG